MAFASVFGERLHHLVWPFAIVSRNSCSLHHLEHLVCCENCLFLWEEQILILHSVHRWMPETPLFHHKLSIRHRVSASKALESSNLNIWGFQNLFGRVPSSTMGDKGETLGWIHGSIILQRYNDFNMFLTEFKSIFAVLLRSMIWPIETSALVSIRKFISWWPRES